MNIQSTSYPEQPTQDFNEWIANINTLLEEIRTARHNVQLLEDRFAQLAASFNNSKPMANGAWDRAICTSY